MLSSPRAGIQGPSSTARAVFSAWLSGSLCARKEASFPEHLRSEGSHHPLALHLSSAGSFQPRVRVRRPRPLLLLRLWVPLSPQLRCRVNG